MGIQSRQKCPKLYWKHTVGSHTIQFENTPFSLGEKQILHCQYGNQYYQSKSHTSGRVFLQGTRKKGCLAHIEVVEFNLYPQYCVQITTSSQNQARMVRENNLKALRKALCSDETTEVVHKYFISLPTEEAHHKCHPTKGVMRFAQRIHPELIAKVQELVSIGTVEPVEVQ